MSFVRASQLWDAHTGTRYPHPAHLLADLEDPIEAFDDDGVLKLVSVESGAWISAGEPWEVRQ